MNEHPTPPIRGVCVAMRSVGEVARAIATAAGARCDPRDGIVAACQAVHGSLTNRRRDRTPFRVDRAARDPAPASSLPHDSRDSIWSVVPTDRHSSERQRHHDDGVNLGHELALRSTQRWRSVSSEAPNFGVRCGAFAPRIGLHMRNGHACRCTVPRWMRTSVFDLHDSRHGWGSAESQTRTLPATRRRRPGRTAWEDLCRRPSCGAGRAEAGERRSPVERVARRRSGGGRAGRSSSAHRRRLARGARRTRPG